MAQSSLQSLLFWDCIVSILLAFLLAETSEVISRNIVFLSHHKSLGDSVQYKVEIIRSENKSCNFSYANLLMNESMGPFSLRPQINYTLTIERDKLKSYSVSEVCIIVTPFKENCSDCSNFTQTIANIEINPYGDLDCFDWDLKCLFQPQEYNELGEDILIQCIPNNQTCANRVAIELFQLLSNTHTCVIETSTRFVIIISATVSVDNPKVIFTKLKPGYYCVHVRPLGCQTDCARYSKVIILQNHTILPSQEPEIGESQQFGSKHTVYIVCAIISVILVGSIIGIFLQRLKKKRSEATTWEFSSVDSSNHISVEGKTCREIREVTILYTQETPEILNCIIALVQFIQKCCDIVVRFDINEEATVRMNPIAWYGRGNLFILIETAGAVYREEGCLDKKEIYHVDEDSLDSYFIHSFMRIINNPDSVVDYSKYIVVRFSYTPKNIMFKTVALNKRYVISQHLAQLCNFLTHGKDMTPTTENLLKFVKKWEDTSEYQNLSLAIERANRFVSQNTNYVQSVLKERIRSY